MKSARFLVILAALAMMAGAAGISAQAFIIDGHLLSATESAVLVGGETWVDVNSSRTVAVVTSIPRDSSGMDYSRATSYTVPVKNELTTSDQSGKNDFYTAAPFPTGSATMDVKTITDAAKKARYGSSGGQWITTDATRTVTAYPIGPDGKADKSVPYTRLDSGYFWHTNNAKPFSGAVSAGCLLSPKACLDRVIATLSADSGKKKITVH
jgi:hypothetical protein